MGQHGDARKLYEQALGLAPNDPTVLSNYGMSYVLTGELDRAEELLRKAIAAPGADSRVRQNLALVVGLQGRFDEAKKIASEELSPEQAAANIAYLKQMLAQQNNWQQLEGRHDPERLSAPFATTTAIAAKARSGAMNPHIVSVVSSQFRTEKWNPLFPELLSASARR